MPPQRPQKYAPEVPQNGTETKTNAEQHVVTKAIVIEAWDKCL